MKAYRDRQKNESTAKGKTKRMTRACRAAREGQRRRGRALMVILRIVVAMGGGL